MIHKVSSGETFMRIAQRYGYFWRTLWEHADNAALRDERKVPANLLVGDEVAIPEPTPLSHKLLPGQHHRFAVAQNRERLKLLIRREGKAVADAPYALWTDADGGKTQGGRTDGQGLVDTELPATATRAELTVTPAGGQPALRYKLTLTALEPVSSDAGVQQRLQLADYYAGPADGQLSGASELALRAYQRDQELAQDDTSLAQTRDKLESVGIA